MRLYAWTSNNWVIINIIYKCSHLIAAQLEKEPESLIKGWGNRSVKQEIFLVTININTTHINNNLMFIFSGINHLKR